jgi:hypothetical protein
MKEIDEDEDENENEDEDDGCSLPRLLWLNQDAHHCQALSLPVSL